MSGVLYYEGMRPQPGTKLLIAVPESNKPVGMWRGELISLHGDDFLMSGEESYPSHIRHAVCIARITDPSAPEDFVNDEPYAIYSAYVATSGTAYLHERLRAAQAEVNGLKRRIEITRSIWHAALKAIISPGAIDQFEKIMEGLPARLKS